MKKRFIKWVLKCVSRAFGCVANVRFARCLQARINAAYVKAFKIDLGEFEPLENYASLNALFTRKLMAKRALAAGFISPCDGKILECGSSSAQAKGEQIALSIKGYTYSVSELLGAAYDDFTGARAGFEDLRTQNSKTCGEFLSADDDKIELQAAFEYVNIYLSPRDYHRYHCPVNMRVKAAYYMSGALFSVNEKSLKKVPNLYARNERFVLECEALGAISNECAHENLGSNSQKSGAKCFYMVFVGALNVGKMCFNFDEDLQKRAKFGANFSKKYDKIELEKGAELGHFELGSTIVLLFKKDDFKLCIKPYQSVKFGETIAEMI